MHEVEERNQTDLGAIRSKAKSGKMSRLSLEVSDQDWQNEIKCQDKGETHPRPTIPSPAIQGERVRGLMKEICSEDILGGSDDRESAGWGDPGEGS